MKVLVTCPPMLGMKDQFLPILEARGIEVFCPEVTQTLSVQDLIELVPRYDGWIIGDDPATREVFQAGKSGRLKAAVKWGIGVDNVDLEACEDLDIPITNTPNMFGSEVADLAIGYLLAAARETFLIDREVRAGKWPKNRGISLAGRTVAVVGYGDIGRNTAKRASVFGLNCIVYDPGEVDVIEENACLARWPDRIEECDFVIFTCALNSENHHMFNAKTIERCKKGLRVVNVARGPLIKEADLCRALESGKVYSAALDVFEEEPLPMNSYIREHPRCILGSHNASNTEDAVVKTNVRAIDALLGFLGIS